MSRAPYLLLLLVCPALAQQAPARSFFDLPSSNGHGAVLVDARRGRLTQFRERLPATEEPELDAQGNEKWIGNQPQMVPARDLLFDAYFGVRAGGQQRWLDGLAVDASGYAAAAPATSQGSGVVELQQQAYGLALRTFVYAPRAVPHAAFAMVLCARNPGASAVSGVSVFQLTNLHLGFGRPGVRSDLAANGETVVVAGNGDVFERGFAGVVGTRPLGAATVTAWNQASSPSENGFFVVRDTTGSFVARAPGDLGGATDWVTGLQFDLGTLAAGEERCVGSVFAHHGDPFAQATVSGWLDAWVNGQGAKALLDAELAGWAAFQAGLRLPTGLGADEANITRQAAVVLAMAQVQEQDAFLREWLTEDGVPRTTRFRTLDGGTGLPGTIRHRGRGAVLASLPPGEWTYAWVRDGSYAAVALAELGLTTEAKEALRFFLDAEAGRFQGWSELQPAGILPYGVSLTRYVGFGVEETDFNAFGPNLEFDGFGLVLWALREAERRSGDTSLVDARWNDIATRIAEPLVGLIDPATGLVRKDSSIWETHWNGRERSWTYTNLTAARGLCDAAELAQRRGDAARATTFREAGRTLRANIAAKLTDAAGALASNREELLSGRDYFDAAVLEGVAMGLFDPSGRIARATLDALDRQLKVPFGPGWSRNDDLADHAGATDLSPWGSDYDSAEWVVTDLRGVVAMRAAGRAARADALLGFTREQSLANALAMAETYDPASGAWKFNAPMVGFGAGAWVLALAHRGGRALEPACGAFFDEGAFDAGVPDAGPPAGDAGLGADAGLPPDAGASDGGTGDAGVAPTPPGSGCGCSGGPSLLAAALGVLLLRRRTRGPATCARSH